MKSERLREILGKFRQKRILVIGDFFLDKYFLLDPARTEISLETNLEAYQVVDIRCSPGAAGTVTSNLRAMEVQVSAVGVIGDDGEGYDLRRRLQATGVDVTGLIVRQDRRTPTYAKPMMQEKDGSLRELNRLDTKNLARLPAEAEEQMLQKLRERIEGVDAVIAADQVPEEDCGCVTAALREELSRLATRYPEKFISADSRERIGRFRNLIVKPNARETVGALEQSADTAVQILAARMRTVIAGEEKSYNLDDWVPCGTWLQKISGKPLFLTMGSQGILVFENHGFTHQPARKISGPVDIVGAGDATMSGIMAALSAGATAVEAAEVGCLASSVTIRQLGTTGTATQAQILEAWQK